MPATVRWEKIPFFPCPPNRWRKVMPMFQKVIVAIDGSAPGEKALAVALENVPLWNAELHAVHVVCHGFYSSSVIDPNMGIADPTNEYVFEMIKKEGEAIMEKVKKTAAEQGVPLIPHIRIGDARDEILGLAEEIGADLIIMGSTGKGKAKRLLLGSVSSAVITDSPTATLVIH